MYRKNVTEAATIPGSILDDLPTVTKLGDLNRSPPVMISGFTARSDSGAGNGYDGRPMENPSPESSPPDDGCLKRCLITLVIVLLLLVTAYYGYPYLEEYQHNAYVTEKCTEFFNSVKSGHDGTMIFVFDPLLVEMLASDEQCIANLTHLYFVNVDLSDPRYEAVAKLKNLRTLEFYDCYNDEKLFAAMQGMPSIEKITFDSMRESKERERLLKTFPNLKKINYE